MVERKGAEIAHCVTLSCSRPKPGVHGVRHVGARPVPRPVGALLQRLPRGHLRGGQQRQAALGRGEGGARPAVATPGHLQPQDPHLVLLEQDGLQGRPQQRQNRRGVGTRQDHGQAVAHCRQQRAHRGGAAGGGRVVDPTDQGRDSEQELICCCL
jgi:hypothetical protein